MDQKPSLALTQEQRMQMILAPHLRQSLELLQAPILELRNIIEKELQQNPTLEEVPKDELKIKDMESSDLPNIEKELNIDKDYEILAQLDDEWREYFFQNFEKEPYTSEDEEKHEYIIQSITPPETLQDHLLKQLHLTDLSEQDKEIGELLIGYINDDGYLNADIYNLAVTSGIPVKKIEEVLSTIQDFHPVGVGARNIKECLIIQLNQSGIQNEIARQIILQYLDKLAEHKYEEIASKLNTSVEEVRKAEILILSFNPKPGNIFASVEPQYIYPDVIYKKVDNKWETIINNDYIPHLRISSYYKRLLKSKDVSPEVKSYIQEKIRASAFIIRSIEQRQYTIRRVAEEIAREQQEFLEYGIDKLKPLTMSQIAKKLNIHETTVSRAVADKYASTPHGIFELRYFFTPGITTQDGKEISTESVKKMITEMIENEDKSNPLRDQDIVELLKKKNINIARRTVAKYRCMLKIPPSHLRKC